MAKHLIVCCDGTWSTADQTWDGLPCPTNVTRLALSFAPTAADGRAQIVFHQPGVGTGRRQRLRGGAFGVGLAANVRDAYGFLVDNYEPGDKLYLFGFSRGAYTARSVVGMVRNSGILRPQNRDRIGEAYRLYRSQKNKPGGMSATLFRRAFSFETDIEVLGVWDTVGALGIPPMGPSFLRPAVRVVNKRWEFHDTELSRHVHAAYQALAIDERRRAFTPVLWRQRPGADQVLEQVWFAGTHCDVGGGTTDSSLSDLTLLWMASKVAERGLAFRPGAFPRRGPDDSGELKRGEEVTFTVAPDGLRLPTPSYTWLYRLMASPYHRPIGLDDDRDGGGPGQNVADTAVHLQQVDPERYHPKMLREYLRRTDRPTPEAIPDSYPPRRPAYRGSEPASRERPS